MTVYGDMAAYVSSKAPGIDMPTARVVIALALEAANDCNFALRFEKDHPGWNNAYEIYYEMIKFLKEVNQ